MSADDNQCDGCGVELSPEEILGDGTVYIDEDEYLRRPTRLYHPACIPEHTKRRLIRDDPGHAIELGLLPDPGMAA